MRRWPTWGVERQHWVIPLPEDLSAADAGPLFCGGITVFAPLIDELVSPASQVAEEARVLGAPTG